MPTTARTVVRAGLLGGLALVTAAVTATSAGAASEEVEFSCEVFVFDPDDPEGEPEVTEGTATASFDTAVPDGLVVDVGDRVRLDPFTGTIVLPESAATVFRDAGVTSVQGGGGSLLLVEPTGEELDAGFGVDPTDVPPEGTAFTVEVEGDAGRLRAEEAGVHTILMTDFGLFLEGGEDSPGVDVFCQAEDDVVVDEFEAKEPTATPAPTVTVTTAAPVRPVVVQTDFAGENATALPVLGLGALAMAAAAGGMAHRRVRAASRRH